MIDGFYIGYFSANGGYGVLIFAIKDRILAGVDSTGVKFDAVLDRDENGNYSGDVKVEAPPNITLIQGIETGESGITYFARLSLSSDFLNEPYTTITTQFGPVNLRIEKLRDMGGIA